MTLQQAGITRAAREDAWFAAWRRKEFVEPSVIRADAGRLECVSIRVEGGGDPGSTLGRRRLPD